MAGKARGQAPSCGPGWRFDRWSERRRLAVALDLVIGGGLLVGARMRDIGLEGMFVVTRCRDLAERRALAVEFSLPAPIDDPGHRHHVPVEVVRVEPGGLALHFATFDRHLFRVLERLIYELPAEPAAGRRGPC